MDVLSPCVSYCLYAVGQDLLPTVSDEEMKAMEAEIVRVQQELSESDHTCSALNSGESGVLMYM